MMYIHVDHLCEVNDVDVDVGRWCNEIEWNVNKNVDYIYTVQICI